MASPKTVPNGYLMSKGYSYYVFALLFLLYMFDYIDRMVVVSLFPYLKADFNLSDTQCGLLVSTVYWSIVILSVPVSVVIDRWSRKKSIGIMAVFWSIATVSCAFAKNFGQLFAARTAIGVGEAGYAPAGRPSSRPSSPSDCGPSWSACGRQPCLWAAPSGSSRGDTSPPITDGATPSGSSPCPALSWPFCSFSSGTTRPCPWQKRRGRPRTGLRASQKP